MRSILNFFALFYSRLKASGVKGFLPRSVLNKLKASNYRFLLYYDILIRDTGIGIKDRILDIMSERKTILFYPSIPWDSSMIYHICILRRYLITDSISRKVEIAVNWNPGTYARTNKVLDKLKEQMLVVNYGCNDISKSNIAEIFHRVFGYDLEIDPLVHVGKCVRKSDLNAQHDGQIIDCPVLELQPGSVYQLFIDTLTEDGLALDLRLPVFKDRIPFVLKKYLPADGRFHAEAVRLQIAETDLLFSPQELDMILTFCRQLGLDYGELDVLRDRTTGRLYIVDANNTPHGFPVYFAKRQEGPMHQVLQRQAVAFSLVFMNGE